MLTNSEKTDVRIGQKEKAPPINALNDQEKLVFSSTTKKEMPITNFLNESFSEKFTTCCEPHKKKMEADNLLVGEEAEKKFKRLKVYCLWFMLLLSFYKFMAAVQHGHKNVFFLFLFSIIACILINNVQKVKLARRINYLDELKTAFNFTTGSILLTNIKEVKKCISQPLILENITYHIELPGRTYDDATFLNKLCAASECGLLLDLTNLYINSCNLNFDPFQFMDALNKKNIRQLHYVGIEKKNGQLIDTHAAKTPDEIFQLMKYLLDQHKPQGILLERDDRFEKQEDILDDLLRASAIYNGREYAGR